MIDARLKAARETAMETFADAIAAGHPPPAALALAQETHFDLARPFCPDIDAEVELLEDLLRDSYPEAFTASKWRRQPSPKHDHGARFRSNPPAKTEAATAGPTPPMTAEPSAQRETPMAPSSEDTVPTALANLRRGTIAEYQRLLRRISPAQAFEEVIDDHIDRAIDLGFDPDDEQSAITGILKALPTKPPEDERGRPGERSGSSSRRRPQGNQRRPSIEPSLLRSPYRFVPLSETVVSGDRRDGVSHDSVSHDLNRPLPDGYCGRLTVAWAAESPLLIGGANGIDAAEKADAITPMNIGTADAPKYVVPGSTIKGYLRSALEVVTAGRLTRIDAQKQFGLRDFDHPRIRSEGFSGAGQSLLDVRNIKAGFLRKTTRSAEDGTSSYEIVPCAGWGTIAIAHLPARPPSMDQYDFRAKWLKKGVKDRYQDVDRDVVNDDGTVDFTKVRTRRFKKISKEVDPTRAAAQEFEPDDNGPFTGMLVFSNRSPAAPSADRIRDLEHRGQPGQPKKREYVFLGTPNQVSSEKCISIPSDAWRRFTDINCRLYRNKKEPEGSWKELHKSLELEGGFIPVFYVMGDDTDHTSLQFGLTRYFKIAHAFSVGDMRDRDAAHAADGPFTRDFVDSLLGYVDEPKNAKPGEPLSESDALKGRMAMGFAHIDNGKRSTRPYETVMGTPQASFAPFYLTGRTKDWSSPDRETRLAGRKRYVPRVKPGTPFREAQRALNKTLETQISRLVREGGKVSDDIKTKLHFLEPKDPGADMTVTGEIRFHNVRAEEIGALLWVLTHGGDPRKPCRHLVGHAKNLGAGQLRVKSMTLMLTPNSTVTAPPRQPPQTWELPDDEAEGGPWEGWVTPDSWSMTGFLQAFHALMIQWRPNWPHCADMKAFLSASDPDQGATLDERGKLDYPMLKDFRQIRDWTKMSTRHTPPSPDNSNFLAMDVQNRPLILPYQ